MKLFKVLIPVLLFTGLFFFSCQMPEEQSSSGSGGNNGKTDNSSLRAPGDVWVFNRYNGFYVVWEPVEGADYYEIYRQVGCGEIELIEDRCENTWYIDVFNTNKPVRYYVKSCKDGDSSEPSEPSEYISKYVLNVNASRFEYDNKIEIEWDEHSSAESYNVYRYIYKSDTDPVKFENIIDTIFSDEYDVDDPDTIEYETPYYYKVSYIDEEGEEKGLDGPFSMGVFGTEIDFYEPNDDYTLFIEAESSSSFSQTQPPIIYSFGDEAGGVDSDLDWYVYYGLPENFFVKVWLPSGTPFADGELRFQFYYPLSGDIYTEQLVYTGGVTMQSFNDFGDVPEDENVRVYFKVYPVINAGKDISGNYFVEITDEL